MRYRSATRSSGLTSRRALIAIAALGILALVITFLAPVYGFFAYREGAPLPPWGWFELEQQAPQMQVVHDPAFEQAGAAALQHVAAYRRSISVPSMSAAVAINGRVVWAGAAGWADLESGASATTDTVYRIGSTSKALTATGLARLVDRGLLDLDAPITDHVPAVTNPSWQTITARQLASHMSGLPHYRENTEYGGLYHTVALQREFANVADAVAVFDESEMLFDPGSDFHYSSLGTVLLGATMGYAAGSSYREVIHDEVLQPAGAVATQVAPKTRAEQSAFATFYLRREGRFREWRAVDLSHRLPGGGWASTPSDLVRIGSLHLDDAFISTATRDAFWTPQVLADGSVNEQDYAIGWRWREYEVEGIGVARNANHGGVSRGAQSWLLVFPDYEMAIAFTTNTNTEEFADFGMAWEGLFEAFARELPVADMPEPRQ